MVSLLAQDHSCFLCFPWQVQWVFYEETICFNTTKDTKLHFHLLAFLFHSEMHSGCGAALLIAAGPSRPYTNLALALEEHCGQRASHTQPLGPGSSLASWSSLHPPALEKNANFLLYPSERWQIQLTDLSRADRKDNYFSFQQAAHVLRLCFPEYEMLYHLCHILLENVFIIYWRAKFVIIL